MQCYDLLPPLVRQQLQEMAIDVQNLPIELVNAIANGWAPAPHQIVEDLKRLDVQLRAQLNEPSPNPRMLRNR